MPTNYEFARWAILGRCNLSSKLEQFRWLDTANISMSSQFINLFLQRKLLNDRKNIVVQSRQISFKQRVIATAIALLTLPLFAPKSSAENWSANARLNRIEIVQSATQQAAVTYVPRRRPPTHLWLETGAGVLLLTGLIVAYLANRPRKSPTITATDAQRDQIDIDVSPQRVTSLLPQPPVIEEDTAVERAELLKEITLRFQQSLDVEDLLRTATKEVRRALKTDRAVIYAFNRDNWQGDVVAESVGVGLPQTLRIKIDDPCLPRLIEDYKKGRIRAINDITREESGLTECHRKLLEQFAVKANLVAPILHNDQLFGLLIVHQCDRPRVWQPHEMTLFSQLGQQLSFALQQVNFLEKQQAEAEQSQLIQETSFRLRQSFDVEDLFKTAVKEVRRAIRADRILIYQLDTTTWQGTIIAESVGLGLPQTWRVKIEDPCFRERYAELYKQGRVRAINDIHQEPGLSNCYIKLLEQFAVKASLVAPIMQNDVLFGLLIAHQCDRPRVWQPHEIGLISQLSQQVGLAINQIVS